MCVICDVVYEGDILRFSQIWNLKDSDCKCACDSRCAFLKFEFEELVFDVRVQKLYVSLFDFRSIQRSIP
jgi:hypothetical protein